MALTVARPPSVVKEKKMKIKLDYSSCFFPCQFTKMTVKPSEPHRIHKTDVLSSKRTYHDRDYLAVSHHAHHDVF